jgi:hypothetical protein
MKKRAANVTRPGPDRVMAALAIALTAGASSCVPQLTCDLVHDHGCWCRSAWCDLVRSVEVPSNTTWLCCAP